APTTAASTATTAGGGSGGTKTTIRLWLNGDDTKQELVDYAVAEFKKQHPDADVKFERQQWTGIVEKLTTALSSSDSPDVVELGNTQAQAFEAAGALKDLTTDKATLGGSDLLESLVEAGTYNGKFYGVPYYAGARIVVYRTDLLAKSGLKVPTTLQEFIDAGIKLQQDNAATTPGFSGIYFPGKYWYAALPFIWQAGGDIAVQKDGKWRGTLADAKSVKGLDQVKEIMDKASGAPKDGDESKDYVAFCNNQIGMLMAPGWKIGQITNTKDGCPAMADKIGAFALPGDSAGSTAPAFLGGSNLAVSAKSAHQDLALDLVKIMTSKGYQQQFAAAGTIPALKSLLGQVSGDAGAKAQAVASANSRFVPSSEHWAGVEASTVLPDMLVSIAQGGDVGAAAKTADNAITSQLKG
ncbi:MAG TPA: extracellular solute-binding protein, partial [Acidimicrobiales bacterium]|nr:extracellular solute-binding protein [Acidimicrobiales bacterium]